MSALLLKPHARGAGRSTRSSRLRSWWGCSPCSRCGSTGRCSTPTTGRNTSSQLLADPKIEAAVGGVLVNELFSSVDVSAEIKGVLPSQPRRARLAGDGGTARAGDPGRPAGALDRDGPERMATGQPQCAARAAADPERRQQDGLDEQRRRRPPAAPAARAARHAARPAGTAGERAVEAAGLHRRDRAQAPSSRSWA